jgi:NitT/TauT family transport system ATP-binding protein
MIESALAMSESDTRPRAGLAVSLKGVTKRYDGGIAALGPFDLDVRDGDFVSLLGPSGCGKSTALRIISGLSTPTSGTVRVGGDGRSIGFVFQEPTLMPWASVRDNVALPLKLARQPRANIDAHVGAVLARVGLAEFAAA